MTVELNVFSGMLEPKKGSLEKNKDLPVYAGSVKAKNKSAAQVMLHGIFLQFAPELADDYFKPKLWEDREGVPRPELMGVLVPDFFSDKIVWNAEKGEPERVLAEPELTENNSTPEKMSVVKTLPSNYRAASLVLFGLAEEITATQYGQIMDLVNDEERSLARELTEAISREPRVLELLPERQEELLAHLRATIKETAQWPDIKRPINKWLDTPPAKREPVKLDATGAEMGNETHTESGCTLGGGNTTDRAHPHTLATLRRETCIGILAITMDFDIYELPHAIHDRAKKMEESGTDERFTAWWKQFRRTPGILDFSKAAIIALIKSAPEDIYRDPVSLREYINKNLTESDHASPDPLVIDIACGRTSAPLPQARNDASESSNWSQSTDDQINADIDRTLAARAAAEQQHDDRLPVCDREIEIAHALNGLLSGQTNIVDKADAEYLITCTGQLIAQIFPLLITDIETTEYCLSPNFTDEEIQDVATTILEKWSDDVAVRQKIALDAIVEYRRPEPPKPVMIDPPVVTPKPVKEPEPTPVPTAEHVALTWRQQLIIAALRGMTSNPAYSGMHEDIPFMAVALADGVINAESDSD